MPVLGGAPPPKKNAGSAHVAMSFVAKKVQEFESFINCCFIFVLCGTCRSVGDCIFPISITSRSLKETIRFYLRQEEPPAIHDFRSLYTDRDFKSKKKIGGNHAFFKDS